MRVNVKIDKKTAFFVSFVQVSNFQGFLGVIKHIFHNFITLETLTVLI